MKNYVLVLFVNILLLPLIFSCKNSTEVIMPPDLANKATDTFDVVIYGSTPSGIIAALQVVKMNKTVVIVSTSSRIGGMVAGGLSNTDVGNKQIISGLCLDYFKSIGYKYGLRNAPKWSYEPKMALQVFNEILTKNHIPIIYNDQLRLKNGVVIENNKIKLIKLESGKAIKGNMFIDASYEGDLMASCSVSYTIGRESSDMYNENLNGAFKTVYFRNIDPFLEEGNVKSELLPQMEDIKERIKGAGDSKIQAFNFRVCLTENISNKIKIEKPVNYDEKRYEFLIRVVNAYPAQSYWSLYPTVNGKYDANNGDGFPSFDCVGMNRNYFDLDYSGRRNVKIEHENYIKGLIWTLQNNPRIPESVRVKYNSYGLARDEFQDNGNWPTELYIREGRRMKGEFIMTQKEILEGAIVPEPIAMGSYGIDCHGIQFFAGPGKRVNMEGSIYNKVIEPYQISYQSITPKHEECENLLVPVCLSASHVAYCSIRMEPQYMMLGQVAGTASVLAIESKCSVQNLNYSMLKNRLLQDKLIIHY